MTALTRPSGGDEGAVSRAAFLLQWCADCLRARGTPDDLGAFPYVPEMEEVAEKLRTVSPPPAQDGAAGQSPETPETDALLSSPLLRDIRRGWKGALIEHARSLERRLRAAEGERSESDELHRMQLAAISVLALCNTREAAEKHRIGRDNPYWTPSLQDVYAAVDREVSERERATALEAALEAGREDGERWKWAKDILAGDDEQVTNSKTLFVAAGLMRGESIDQIVDAALAARSGGPAGHSGREGKGEG